MAGEVQLLMPSLPATAYFVVRNSVGQFWNTAGTPAFEAYNAANWTDYDIALTQSGASQHYAGTFPSAIAAGVYSLTAYIQGGASPAITDTLAGQDDTFHWSGTARRSLNDVKLSGETHTSAVIPTVSTVNGLANNVITAASIASDAITAAAIASDAITSAKIATDAIGAAQIAASAVTEIQSGLSTLTQTQITGGAYALNSASFAFNAALPLTTQQKADANTEADTAAADYGALKPTTAGRTLDVSAGGEAGIDWAAVQSACAAALTAFDFTTKDVGDVTGDVGGKIIGGGSGTITGTGVRADDRNGDAIPTAAQIRDVSNASPAANSLGAAVNEAAGSATNAVSYITTALNRLGAWSGTGINTILGWAKSTAKKDATAPSDIGGTFDPATDSLEALRERGDSGAWGSDATAIADSLIAAVDETGLKASSFTPEALDQLRAAEIDLSQWDPDTDPVKIYRGVDHLHATGNAFTFRNVAGNWPDLTGCTIRMELIIDGVTAIAGAGTIVTASGANQEFYIQVLRTAFDGSLIKDKTGVFRCVRIDGSGNRFPLANGVATLFPNTAPAA